MALKNAIFVLTMLIAFLSAPQGAISQLRPLQPLSRGLQPLKPLGGNSSAVIAPAINSYYTRLEEERARNLKIAEIRAKNLAERARQDSLRLASGRWEKIGMRLTYSQPFPINGSELDRFLWSLGKIESGHRYYVRNPYSGAYGKYQFLPSTWRLWASRYAQANGKDASTQTPENQERVARFKAKTLYGWYGRWEDVASVWFTGKPYYYFRRPWQIGDGYMSLPGYTGAVVRGMNKK